MMVTILFTLICVLYTFEKTQAKDPFEGFVEFECVKCKGVFGCSGESLADAYLKTEAAQSDEIFSKPDTKAYLFTNKNKDTPECLHKCGGKLPSNTVYTTENNTVIIVSGYFGAMCNIAYLLEMKEQLLHRGNYSVIIIDWPWGNQGDYYAAVRNTKVVGKQIAFLIKNIMEQKNITAEKCHIIGHSLGAHIAGYAGAALGGLILRISGLDPAGPGYQTASLDDRLDPSDAKQVDVIHTNAGECLPFSFGLNKQCGHADFYPNGGRIQPFSLYTIIPSLLKGDFAFVLACLYLPLCSHLMAPEYYKVSINPCSHWFIGVECRNYPEFKFGGCRSCGEDHSKCAVMGMDWEYYRRPEGNHSYYLKTGPKCPYVDNSGINPQGFPARENTSLHCYPQKTQISSAAKEAEAIF